MQQSSNPFLLPAPSQRRLSLRFDVPLDEEVTLVSYKRLLRKADHGAATEVDHGRAVSPIRVSSALEARISSESTPPAAVPVIGSEDAPAGQQQNRLVAVIEKIERLYRGQASEDDDEEDKQGHGSDHGEANVEIDRGSDEYDTNDSFIDDRELDEYFSVANVKSKHSGYFINKGQLEQSELPPVASRARRIKRKKKKLVQLKRSLNPKEDSLQKIISETPRKRRTLGTLSGRKRPLTPKSDAAETPPDAQNLPEAPETSPEKVPRASPDATPVLPALPPVETVSAAVEREIDGTQRYEVFEITSAHFEQLLEENLEPETSLQQRENATAVKVSVYSEELESALRNLQTLVSSTPQPSVLEDSAAGVSNDGTNSQQQSRMPRMRNEVKAQLSLIVKLSSDGSDRVPDGVKEQIAEIMKPIMLPSTLKNHLKAMSRMGKSVNERREQQLSVQKLNLSRLIEAQMKVLLPGVTQLAGEVACSEHPSVPEGSTEVESTSLGKFVWTNEIEEEIHKIYDQYLEDVDEEKGSKSRKLCGELVGLWPKGWMDRIGIREAIARGKKRCREEVKLKKQQSKPSAVKAGMISADNGSIGSHGQKNSKRVVKGGELSMKRPKKKSYAMASEKQRILKVKESSSAGAETGGAAVAGPNGRQVKVVSERNVESTVTDVNVAAPHVDQPVHSQGQNDK